MFLFIVLFLTGGTYLSLQVANQSSMKKQVLQAASTTVTLYATEDSYVSSNPATGNFGTVSPLVANDAGPRSLVYLKFDLTPLAGKVITSASLQLTNANTYAGTVDIRAMTDTSWAETALNYNNKPATYISDDAFDGGTFGGISSGDVTADVQKNVGSQISFRLDNGDDESDFFSRETGTATAPRLVITYDPASTYIPLPTPTPMSFIPSGCSAFASDVLLVIDQSVSVRNDWAQIAADANAFIDKLAKNTENHISVITFSRIGYIRTPLSNNFAASKNAITGLVPELGTCVECGTQAVADEIYMDGRQNTQKIAVLLTDAKANTIIKKGNGRGKGQTEGYKNFDTGMDAAMDEALVTYNRDGTHFYTIGFGNATTIPRLTDLANATGGDAYAGNDSTQINAALTNIADTIGLGNGSIAGTVYNDKNRNGNVDTGEAGLPNWEVDLSGGTSGASASLLTDTSGKFSFSGLCDASYQLSQNPQAGWLQTFPANNAPYQVNIANGSNVTGRNFLVAQGYTVTGNVFDDVNKNRKKDGTETNIAGAKISATGGTATIANGAFTVTGLPAGTYTVSYTSPLPNGYFTVYPKNGPPPSFLVTVGPGCNVDGTTGGTCTNGNVSNLNFAISNSVPWIQTYNFDARFDNGQTNPIPQNPTYQSYMMATDADATSPGVLYIGDGFLDIGQGQVSSKNWKAGGTVYSEVANTTTQSKLTYASLLSKAQKGGVKITDLASICALANCNLPGNLPNGVYQAKTNLVLNAYNFPLNKNFVILAASDVTIRGNLQVPKGSTATLAAAGSITVDKTVGVSGRSPLPLGQVQGIFSAGKDFIVQGNNDCVIGADNMLNVEGTVSINTLQNGGKFINQRDLCGGDQLYPSITFKGRADFILNTPSFLMQQRTISQEIAP